MRSEHIALPVPRSLHADNPHAYGHTTHPTLADVAKAMLSPFFELDTAEAAAMLAAVAEAHRDGYPFDDFTLALVDVLRRQLQQSDDGEADVCVDADGQEIDDEGSCTGEWNGAGPTARQQDAGWALQRNGATFVYVRGNERREAV